MQLLKDINEVFSLNMPMPEVHCKTCEDNNGCIALANGQKFSPRTKHIVIINIIIFVNMLKIGVFQYIQLIPKSKLQTSS